MSEAQKILKEHTQCVVADKDKAVRVCEHMACGHASALEQLIAELRLSAVQECVRALENLLTPQEEKIEKKLGHKFKVASVGAHVFKDEALAALKSIEARMREGKGGMKNPDDACLQCHETRGEIKRRGYFCATVSHTESGSEVDAEWPRHRFKPWTPKEIEAQRLALEAENKYLDEEIAKLPEFPPNSQAGGK